MFKSIVNELRDDDGGWVQFSIGLKSGTLLNGLQDLSFHETFNEDLAIVSRLDTPPIYVEVERIEFVRVD